MKILNIFPAYTTPLQTIGLGLYIYSIIAMFFKEKELLYSEFELSKLGTPMFWFVMGITIFSFDSDTNKAELISILMAVIGIVIMMIPLIVGAVIETIQDKKKGSKKNSKS